MNRLLILLACGLALAACGERDEPTTASATTEKLRLILDYYPNADHAGIYAAMDSGAFEQAGIDLEIVTPADPAAPLNLLAAGKADFAISYEPEVLLARDKGRRLVSIAALVQKPLTSIIALGDKHIRSVDDLAGKTVGTAGIPYQAKYLDTVLEAAGVDRATVKQVDVGFNLVPSLLSKKVDATLGAFWNYEGVELARRKKDPSILRMEQLGLPTYNELVVVAREEDLRGRGAIVRRFLQALARGHEAVRKDVAAGVEPLVEANKDLDPGLQTASVRATLPVFFPEDEDLPFGWQVKEDWVRFGRWMHENGLISKPATAAALTNEFLPGEGL